MTNEEASETIKTAIEEVEWCYPLNYEIAFEVAISALEKQIPKKPAEHGDGINYDCPVCGMDVGYFDCMAWETPKYCSECGQALDWERKEEG